MPRQRKGKRDWKATIRRWLRSLKEIDALGWPAWFVVFAALAYPGILAARMITYEQMSTRVTTISFGLVLAAVAAAFITWGLNGIVTRVADYRKEAARRKNKGKKARNGKA
ncbi:MAG TPA: hypothetical protein PKI11_07270 [Candidatus Hydrogenedentes bacterium]|nr:hypothetical protein [Candidatus Hydrogenedentota bacterium]